MTPGDVVKPTRGRDEGRLMFIVDRDGDDYLLLADGRLRRVEKPKRKKCKHIQLVSSPEGDVPDKLRAGEKVANSALRRTLSQYALPGDAAAEGGCVWPKTTLSK